MVGRRCCGVRRRGMSPGMTVGCRGARARHAGGGERTALAAIGGPEELELRHHGVVRAERIELRLHKGKLRGEGGAGRRNRHGDGRAGATGLARADGEE